MDGETKHEEGIGEDVKPQDPNTTDAAQDGTTGEDVKPQDPNDPRGDAINKHKYDRDMANKDKAIAERDAEIEKLKSQLDEKASEGDKYAQLKKELDDYKQQVADEKINTKLASAGCVNVKAARAVLGDYDEDVSKLKEACPYLFAQETRQRSTGGNPAGSPGGEPAKSIREALRSR